MNVVVVESPAKAKTINKYLGAGYTVLASYGHVRDLPSKDGSVKPDEDFAMLWDTDPKAKKRLADIADAMKGATRLILATDPDREGEAISWHVLEALNRKKAVKGAKPKELKYFVSVTASRGPALASYPNDIFVIVYAPADMDEDSGLGRGHFLMKVRTSPSRVHGRGRDPHDPGWGFSAPRPSRTRTPRRHTTSPTPRTCMRVRPLARPPGPPWI